MTIIFTQTNCVCMNPIKMRLFPTPCCDLVYLIQFLVLYGLNLWIQSFVCTWGSHIEWIFLLVFSFTHFHSHPRYHLMIIERNYQKRRPIEVKQPREIKKKKRKTRQKLHLFMLIVLIVETWIWDIYNLHSWVVSLLFFFPSFYHFFFFSFLLSFYSCNILCLNIEKTKNKKEFDTIKVYHTLFNLVTLKSTRNLFDSFHRLADDNIFGQTGLAA